MLYVDIESMGSGTETPLSLLAAYLLLDCERFLQQNYTGIRHTDSFALPGDHVDD